MGILYQETGQIEEPKQTFDNTVKRPMKFSPLNRLTELYLETGRKEEARVLAEKILDKQVKIPSLITISIKSKMRNLLNELDSLNDSPQLIESDMKPTTISSWQNCLLDLRTPRALLPT